MLGPRFRPGLPCCCAAFVAVLSLSLATAAPFTPGNLVVLRVGDGSAALGSTGTAIFLDEYTPSGSLIQTISLPTAASGSNRRFVLSGTAPTEGALTRCVNGLFLTCIGYDAATGTTGLITSSSSTVNRVVAVVNGAGAIDTSTALADAASANPRGAVSLDGNAIWFCGGPASARFTFRGSTGSTQLSTSTTILRVANIFNGQLYVSSPTASNTGVLTVGTGLPTTGGNSINLLNGFPGSATSPGDFYFANSNTIYMVDDSTASTGGIYKFVLSGGSWTGNQFSNTVSLGIRGLCGTINSAGQAVLYFTTAENPPRIRKLIDNGSFSALTSVVATGTTDTGFRGIDFAPVTPIAVNDNFATNPGQQLSVTSPGVLSNDSGPGDPGFGFTAILDTTVPAGHSLTLNPNGSFTYTPAAGFTGQTSFTYHAFDGFASSATAVVTITVPNTAPTLDAITTPQNVNEGTLLTFTAVGHDSDPGQTLTYSIGPGAPVGASIDAATGVFTFTPDESQGGMVFNMTVRVSDNGNPSLSASQVVQIVVNEVNSAPTLSGMPATATIDESANYQFTASATDPDNPANSLTFSLVGEPSGATINATTGQFSWTPTEAQGGNPNSVYNFSVRVTDNGIPNLSDTKPIQITVREVDQAPHIHFAESTNVEMNEGELLTLHATATDDDLPAQTMTYSLTGTVPGGATINSSTGVFTWTPSESQGPGTYDFNIRVTDDGPAALYDSAAIHVVVNEVDQAPHIHIVEPTNVEMNEGELLTLHATATDDDLPAQTLTYSLTGTVPAGATINSTTGVFTWTPTEAQGPMTADFNIVVTDNGPGTLSDSAPVHIVVDEVNQAPVIDTIIQSSMTVFEGETINITIVAHDDDIPANTVIWSLSGTAPSGAAINPTTGEFSWTPSESQGPGIYDFDAVVTDNGSPNLSDSVHFHVIVDEVNQAPVFDGGPTDFNIDEMVLFSHTFHASDYDLPAQTVTYSLENEPAGAEIFSTGECTWTPTEAQGPGVYDFDVVASDGVTATHLPVHFVVNEVNRAPVIDPIGPFTINEMEPFNVTAEATDPDGNVLAWALRLGTVPEGASIDPDTGEFSWTPNESQGPGVYDITIDVTDNGNPQLSASTVLHIEVLEVNRPPVLDPIGNKNAVVGSALEFTATASDPDIPANTLTFSLTNAPIGASIDANTGAFSWIPALPGVYTFDVVVTDNGDPNLSDSETIQVTVSAAATTQATLTVELQGVQLPIGTTLHRWLHVTLGTAAGGPNAPIEIDTIAAFNDIDGVGGQPAQAIVVLNDPQPPGGPRLDLVLVTDKLHTVAKKIPLLTVTPGIYVASFTGVNGLKSGDANNDNIVDIVDYAIFAVHYGEDIGADTTINQGFSMGHIVIPHPDFSGDGFVLTADYTFVGANFGLVGDDPPGGYRPSWRLPRTVVSVKELLAEQVKNAASLDLNKDGWVTMAEISEWLQRR